jgi:hypothetical protein
LFSQASKPACLIAYLDSQTTRRTYFITSLHSQTSTSTCYIASCYCKRAQRRRRMIRLYTVIILAVLWCLKRLHHHLHHIQAYINA